MPPYVAELLPRVIEMAQDSAGNARKRTVALATLGHLVGRTGYVVTPYKQFPQLLEMLLGMMRQGGSAAVRGPTGSGGSGGAMSMSSALDGSGGDGFHSWALRREVLQTFGILGALDPMAHAHLMQEATRAAADDAEAAGQDGIMSGGGGSPGGVLGGQGGSTLASAKPEGRLRSTSRATRTRGGAGRNAKPAAAIAVAESLTLGSPTESALVEKPASEEEASTNPADEKLSPSSEDYYAKVAIRALMSIIEEPALSVHHYQAVQVRPLSTLLCNS